MFRESSLYSSMLSQKEDMGRSHKLNFVIAFVPNRLLVFRIMIILIVFYFVIKIYVQPNFTYKVYSSAFHGSVGLKKCWFPNIFPSLSVYDRNV